MQIKNFCFFSILGQTGTLCLIPESLIWSFQCIRILEPNLFLLCKPIQYHEKMDGVVGNFTGIKIVNSTTCSIDLSLNPKGKCRKQIFAYHQTSDFRKADDSDFDHFQIMWSCETGFGMTRFLLSFC